MRRTFDARVTFPVLAVALACSRSAELTPADPPASPSGSSVRPALAVGPAAASAPPLPPPDLPRPARDPDWGLLPADPADDYVTRYLHASKRYGAETACIVVKPSTFADDHDLVETQNDASGACGKAGEVRDRFFVTVATDRMRLDPSLHQPKLQQWPDGSDPGDPPGKVADIQDLRAWKTSLRETFRKLELAPLRVQLYGRGSYPIITIAGWHGPVQRTMTAGELEKPAKALCDANDGEPLGIFAGLDRSVLLRINCPGSARFESL